MSENPIILNSAFDKTVPQTHVMIIGVGKYDHLPGGSGTVTNHANGMGQLSSPGVSARAMANWFLSGKFNNPAKPLGSVCLLLSEDGDREIELPSGETQPVPLANSSTFKSAFIGWFERCEEHQDNLSVIYFCGHGVSSGSQMSLLLSDFGENRHAPLEGAIDLRSIQVAMAHSRASNQIWLVDACRSDSPLLSGLDQQLGVRPIAPDASKRVGMAPPKIYISFSTLVGSKAYGKSGECTEYTKAILRGLEGHAAIQNSDGWWVTTTELSSTVQQHMDVASPDGLYEQFAEIDRQSLFSITKAEVDLDFADAHVTTRKKDLWDGVHLNCFKDLSELQSAKGLDLSLAGRMVWEVRLPAAKYLFQASWPGYADTPDVQQEIWIVPPYKMVSL